MTDQLHQTLQHLQGPVAGVDVGLPQLRPQKLIAAEHIQRQIAIAVVVAVKEPSLLLAVQRVVGGVKVQDQQPGAFLVVRRKDCTKNSSSSSRLGDDLLVARSIARRGCPAVSRRLSVLLPAKGLPRSRAYLRAAAFQILLPAQQRQKRIGCAVDHDR